MQHLPVITKDGSHTIHLPELDVTYHSRHGAISESRHVFIEAGLKFRAIHPYESPLKILEMGFGTGLNALLSLDLAEKEALPLHYTAIEAFPLPAVLAGALNYTDLLQQPGLEDRFAELHRAPFDKDLPISPHFILKKLKGKIQDLLPQWNSAFDLIYYDAFAPLAQPELWTPTIFEQLYKASKKDGILVTYCSKGDVRRAMMAAGFVVSKLPGPIGKREMLRAVKN